jgi:medium-chain acyl-[acyl-carrier-protein] hydrolase
VSKPAAALNRSEPASCLRAQRALAAARRRLICIPYAGGGASVFRNWAKRLPADLDIQVIQLRGRQDRLQETPPTRMAAVVDELALALGGLPASPTVLYGHSLGALVAFEVARRMQTSGAPPVALVVGAARGPTLPFGESPIHSLDDERFLEAIHQRYATPWSVLRNADLMTLALPSLRADMEVFETYRYEPGPPLDLPILALRGRQDSRLTDADLSAWQHVTRLPLTQREVEGGHFFVDSPSDSVIEQVTSVLPA